MIIKRGRVDIVQVLSDEDAFEKVSQDDKTKKDNVSKDLDKVKKLGEK